jgi:glycosyltransferase involved in cell wall biosynthesis
VSPGWTPACQQDRKERDVRIVCVAPYVPGPLIPHAGGAFLYRYLATLVREHEVHLLAPDTPDNRALLPDVPDGVTTHIVACRQPNGTIVQRRWWNLRNAPRGLTPGWQVLSGFRHDAEARALIASADVVEIQWDQMLPLIDVLPELSDVPIVAVALDIVAQSFQRRRETSTGVRALWLRWLTWRTGRQERRLLNRCAHLRVLSSKDARLAQEMGVRIPIDVVHPILVPPADLPLAGREGVVACIGALWRPENVDGLLWFSRQVWPRVRRQRPEARLVLTGAQPPPELTALNGHDAISVEGFQAELSPAFADAGVFVVPLRQGAGIKIKVLEAMLHRLPVVTTAVGAEGIEEDAPAGALLVARDAAAMAGMIVELLADPELRAAMAQTAWQWAHDRYSTAVVEATVLSLYRAEAVLRLRAQPRSS